MYEDILPGVDLHYTIEGERIKENIRLKTKEAAGYPLKFHFKHNGMVMKKNQMEVLVFIWKIRKGKLHSNWKSHTCTIRMERFPSM